MTLTKEQQDFLDGFDCNRSWAEVSPEELKMCRQIVEQLDRT